MDAAHACPWVVRGPYDSGAQPDGALVPQKAVTTGVTWPSASAVVMPGHKKRGAKCVSLPLLRCGSATLSPCGHGDAPSPLSTLHTPPPLCTHYAGASASSSSGWAPAQRRETTQAADARDGPRVGRGTMSRQLLLTRHRPRPSRPAARTDGEQPRAGQRRRASGAARRQRQRRHHLRGRRCRLPSGVRSAVGAAPTTHTPALPRLMWSCHQRRILATRLSIACCRTPWQPSSPPRPLATTVAPRLTYTPPVRFPSAAMPAVLHALLFCPDALAHAVLATRVWLPTPCSEASGRHIRLGGVDAHDQECAAA